jgi:hypothetical protein
MGQCSKMTTKAQILRLIVYERASGKECSRRKP